MSIINVIPRVFTIAELEDATFDKSIKLPLGPYSYRLHANALDADGQYVSGAAGSVSFEGRQLGARAKIPLTRKHDGTDGQVTIDVSTGNGHAHIEDGGFVWVGPTTIAAGAITGCEKVEVNIVLLD